MARVRPIFLTPLLSWMCPCTESMGWWRTIASRTAVEPTGFMTAPPCMGRMLASSAGASSRPVPWGGAWKLKIARPMSGIWLVTASILAARSSSGASRKVFHGVGFVHPIETREAAQVDQPAFAERHAGRGVDDVVDLEDVV